MSAGAEAQAVIDQDQDQRQDTAPEQTPEGAVTDDAATEDVAGTEVPSGDNDTPPDSPPDDEAPTGESAESEADEAQASDWITDELRELASSYGIDEDEIAQYGSPVAFKMMCRQVDRQALRSGGGQRRQEAQDQVPPNGKPAVDQDPGRKPDAAQAALSEEDLDLDLSKFDECDEETIRVVKVAKHLQQQNRSLVEQGKQFQEQSSRFQATLDQIRREREEDRIATELSVFHEVLDGMDPSLFGGAGDLGPDDSDLNKRRASVWDAYKQLRNSSEAMQKARTHDQRIKAARGVVRRATMAMFGDEIIATERKATHQAIQEQSRRRRPAPGKGKVIADVPPTRSEPQNIHEQAVAIANSPKIAELFDRIDEANGNAPQ